MTISIEHSASRAADRSATATNVAQAAALLLAFGALVALVLWPYLDIGALVVGALAAAGIAIAAFYVPPELMMRLYGAQPYQAGDLAQLDRIAAELAHRGGLAQAPRLYMVPSLQLSIFSMGRPAHSATAFSEGLLRQLTLREITAMLAREVAHTRRGDPALFGIADNISRVAQAFYYAGLVFAGLNLFRAISGEEPVPWTTVLVLIASPLLMTLVQLALSRSREFAIDRAATLLTGDPLGLASAIARFDIVAGSPLDDLLPPVPARKVPLPSMLRLPPPATQRIALVSSFQPPPIPPLDTAETPRISLVGAGPIKLRPRYRFPGVWF